MEAAAGIRPTHAEASRALLRDSVLDAVGELLTHSPWRDVTMADIATRAGVSRQTLYNTFGNREELARAYLLREAGKLLEGIEDAISANVADPDRALRTAVVDFLTNVSRHPMVQAVFSGENDELMALVTTRGERLLDVMSARLTDRLVATWPFIDREDARIAGETLVRLAISHATLPTAPADQTADDLARLFGPFVEQLLAEAVAGS